ncbi:MAG: hypothetical protein UU18_C0034G0007 [Parcubacteria group bacterium GW2011_GWB2_40_8]|nr:MAG: hypothetical protein UU18_C0034G0007 [Parcubacteria group bacterium GW2011_GWB2_40_8]
MVIFIKFSKNQSVLETTTGGVKVNRKKNSRFCFFTPPVTPRPTSNPNVKVDSLSGDLIESNYKNTSAGRSVNENCVKDFEAVLATVKFTEYNASTQTTMHIQLLGLTSKSQTVLPVLQYSVDGNVSGNSYVSIVSQSSGATIWTMEQEPSGTHDIDLNTLTAIGGSPVKITNGYISCEFWTNSLITQATLFWSAPLPASVLQ